MNDKKARLAALAIAMVAVILSGCMRNQNGAVSWRLSDSGAKLPPLPERLEIGRDGMPTLTVYDVQDKKNSKMNIEDYVAGVVAGEMKNDWPMEALKAQAILARTFVLKFCQDKSSKYDGSDISTDVSEAQAYAADSVNDRVRQAVSQTRGMAMTWKGTYPNAWFHAHSGGMTELPSVALEFRGGDPEYLKPTASEESDRAPESAAKWRAVFSEDQVEKACADAGVKVEGIRTVELGERGESGRVKTVIVNGESVSAPSFRLQIGANRLRSTLIDRVQVEGDSITFEGRGFGHGVGLSQWGAYQMAEDGKDAGQIIQKYFPGVGIAELW